MAALRYLVVFFVSAICSAGVSGQTRIDTRQHIEISTVVYGADGRLGGATARRLLPQPGQSESVVAYTGSSICMPSAGEQPSPDAAVVWQVTVTTVRTIGQTATVVVKWRRVAPRSTAAAESSATLQLAGRSPIVLDYFSNSSSTPKCDALGVGLAVSSTDRSARAVIEATATLHDSRGTAIQTQTGRVRVGGAAELIFDKQNDLKDTRLEVSVMITPQAHVVDGAQLVMKIVSRRVSTATGAHLTSASSGYEIAIPWNTSRSWRAPLLPDQVGDLHVAVSVRSIQ